MHKDHGFTMLPHLNVKLPHIWIQHAFNTKSAVKSDNAAIDNTIWYHWVGLVFPSLRPCHINSIKQSMIQSLSKILYEEFMKYIWNKLILVYMVIG